MAPLTMIAAGASLRGVATTSTRSPTRRVLCECLGRGDLDAESPTLASCGLGCRDEACGEDPSDSGTSERWPITRSGSENARFAVPPYRSIGASARSQGLKGLSPAGTCRCTTTHGVSVVAVDARLTAMTPSTESATRRPPTMARVLGRFGAEMTGLAWPESGGGECANHSLAVLRRRRDHNEYLSGELALSADLASG